MANPTGKGGKRWKPGQSGNPLGRSKKDAMLESFRKTTYEDFINQLQKYGSLTKEQMEANLERKDTTMFELIFGKILIGAANGDKDSRQVLLERLWGKVKDQIVHSATGGAELEQLRRMSDIELSELVKKNLEEPK